MSLGEVAEDVTVGHVGTMAREYRESGIPFIRSLNVLPHRFDLADVRFIDEKFHSKLKKSALRPRDVVTVRTGKPGTTAVVPDDWPAANCSDVVITRVGDHLDPYWLSYYINSAAAGFVSSRLVGAVQQHFNVGAAKEMHLALPPLAEQRAIAEVLGALDDKIAANRNLIEIADDLAGALVLRSERWVPIAEVVDYRKMSRSPDKMGAEVVAHYSLPAFDAGELPVIEATRDIKSAKFLIEHPSVLISKLNPRFPRVWDLVELSEQPAFASTEFLVLESRHCSTSVLSALLRHPEVSSQLESKVAGTSGSHQRVKPDDLLATEIPDPRSLGDDIKDSLTSTGRLVHDLRVESASLSTLRDTLLPRLMSGELRVREAEKQVGAVL